MHKSFLFLTLALVSIPMSIAHAEHVLDIEAFGQHLDISQLEAEKFVLEVGENSYDVYFGFHGSLDDSMSGDVKEPVVSKMTLNQDSKSLEFDFQDVPRKTDFWVRIPFDVLTADKEQYKVLINDIDTGYDLMKMPDGYVIGMIISEDTKNVEIIGTKVIPEFGAYSILVLCFSVMGIIYIVRKSPFGINWPRIN